MDSPLCEKLPYIDSCRIFSYFANQPWSIFLDSASVDDHFGRFSFIATDPFLTLTSKNNSIKLNEQMLCGDPFLVLKEKLQEFSIKNLPNHPPFQGGAAGYFSYDLCHHLEKLPRSQDDMQFPDMMIGFYDLVIAINHFTEEVYVFSNGFPEKEETKRLMRAKERIKWLKDEISKSRDPVFYSEHICKPESIASNFTRDDYENCLQRTIDYIYAGDIFQANISQRFSCDLPERISPFQLYTRLRKRNPAPFAAFLHYGDTVIASASPERFLKLEEGKVETRPIKGTRPRGKTVFEDQKLAEELLKSEKDRSENVMIVDLLRNDLSRVCKNHTVKVDRLCGLESYATVHHLVSVVTGELKENCDAIDLLRATFPGGSITGAPKIRAMEIIAEIEPTQRGPYCGSIGYIGFDGNMDTSIVIRTYAIKNNKITFQAGGGIVADSNPADEYEETLIKAKALRHVLIESLEG